MLVLTRKTGQSILLGEDIRITVLEVDGEKVSIGIDAPRAVRIMRSELIEETRSVNLESISSAANLKNLKNAIKEKKD